MRSARSRQASPPLDRRFTPRQIITLVALVMLGAVLIPTGVYAAATLVRIQDADSNVLAEVDGGKLRVGDGSGQLTVDGNVGINAQQSTVQIGAREPYAQSGLLAFGSDLFAGATVFTVPNGKRLVLETISLEAVLPDGQRAQAEFRIIGPMASDIATFHLPLQFEIDNGPSDLYAATMDVHGYGAPGADVTVSGERTATPGIAELRYSFTGHLVPA